MIGVVEHPEFKFLEDVQQQSRFNEVNRIVFYHNDLGINNVRIVQRRRMINNIVHFGDI